MEMRNPDELSDHHSFIFYYDPVFQNNLLMGYYGSLRKCWYCPAVVEYYAQACSGREVSIYYPNGRGQEPSICWDSSDWENKDGSKVVL